MSQTVQPGAPRESRFAYYLLMSIMGLTFLLMAVMLMLSYIG